LPARVGCRAGELLCHGHTHQPDQREILERLAELTTVTEIRECFFDEDARCVDWCGSRLGRHGKVATEGA